MKSLLLFFVCICNTITIAQNREREIDQLKLVGKVSAIQEINYEINQNEEKKPASKYTATFHPNGDLKSKEHVFYKNDTIGSVYKFTVDSNGNVIETFDYFPAHILKRQAKLKYDSHNNKISLATTDEGRKSNLTYRNKYDSRNRLVEVVLVSNGRDIKKYSYDYDQNDNMIKELVDSDYLKAINAYQYNGKNLTEYRHIRNGKPDTHYKNFYESGLLTTTIYYDNNVETSQRKAFIYNDKKLLTIIKESGFGYETRFFNYDKFRNWLLQERNTGGKLKYIVERTLTYY